MEGKRLVKSIYGAVRNKISRDRSPTRAGGSSSRSNRRSAPAVVEVTDDPPPAYSPVTPDAHTSAGPPSNLPPPSYITSDEDPYAFLSTFDTIFVIDDSGSMIGPSWRETEAALRAITPICTSHDADGIDLYFLNHRSGISGPNGKADGGYYGIDNPSIVETIFRDVQPTGFTPTGTRLQTILKPYIASVTAAGVGDSIKPVNIIVITDGRPTDDPESVIIQSAMKLDQLDASLNQVGIQFFQVGNERGAREALRELDDDLSQRGIRDMVDAVTWDSTTNTSNKVLSADVILKVVLGAVVRRLDRRVAGRA